MTAPATKMVRAELQLGTDLDSFSTRRVVASVSRSGVLRERVVARFGVANPVPAPRTPRTPRRYVSSDPLGLRRRLDASLRLPPLESGTRDPWSGR